jgi:hypothetical protein
MSLPFRVTYIMTDKEPEVTVTGKILYFDVGILDKGCAIMPRIIFFYTFIQVKFCLFMKCKPTSICNVTAVCILFY